MSYAGLFFGNFDEEGQLEGAGFDEVFVLIARIARRFFFDFSVFLKAHTYRFNIILSRKFEKVYRKMF